MFQLLYSSWIFCVSLKSIRVNFTLKWYEQNTTKYSVVFSFQLSKDKTKQMNDSNFNCSLALAIAICLAYWNRVLFIYILHIVYSTYNSNTYTRNVLWHFSPVAIRFPLLLLLFFLACHFKLSFMNCRKWHTWTFQWTQSIRDISMW